jgi:hypothetical protein
MPKQSCNNEVEKQRRILKKQRTSFTHPLLCRQKQKARRTAGFK